MAQIILITGVVPFTLAGAVCDLRTKKLPNWLTVPALFLALVYHVVDGALNYGGLAGVGGRLLFSLGGFATGFGILFVLWLIGGGGGGDVKMMGSLGAWLGFKLTLYVFLVSAVFVAAASVGVLSYQACRRGFGYAQRRYMSRPDEKIAATIVAGSKSAPRGADRAAEVRQEQRVRRRLMPYGVPLALATWTVLVYSLCLAPPG